MLATAIAATGIATLVVGIAGFLVITIPVNIILGLVALVRTRSRGDKGTGLAVTGLILSVLWAVAIGVGVAAITAVFDAGPRLLPHES